MITEELCDRKMPLSKLTENLMLYPQHLVNMRVKDKSAVMNDNEVKNSLTEVESLIGGKGRVLLRQSGTEPVIRIMVEAKTPDLCENYAYMIAKTVKERGHLCE